MSTCHDDSLLPVQRIVFALGRARNLLSADTHDALAGTGVNSSHVGVLLLLFVGVARTPVALSRILRVDPGFVTRIIDRLERQGLVHRDRNDPDRRVVNLTLTEAGRDVAARVAAIVPEVLNQRLSVFTPLEFATLLRLLDKLLDE